MQGTTPKDVPHAIYLGNVLAWDKVDAGGGWGAGGGGRSDVLSASIQAPPASSTAVIDTFTLDK